jgi:hypothetical protein
MSRAVCDDSARRDLLLEMLGYLGGVSLGAYEVRAIGAGR